MSERGIEIPLSEEEIAAALRSCAPDCILVGGQALAFWADRLDAPRPAALRAAVTADLDFKGTRKAAERVARALRWELFVATPDHATPEAAKVAVRNARGEIKQIDFLIAIAGMDSRAIERHAVELEIPGIGRLRVMDPIDVLDSRLQNLLLLPEKRGREGQAQAALAVDVARRFVTREAALEGERTGLKLLERIVKIARDEAGIHAFHRFALDALRAVPLEAFPGTPSLRDKRWPVILADIGRRRRAG